MVASRAMVAERVGQRTRHRAFGKSPILPTTTSSPTWTSRTGSSTRTPSRSSPMRSPTTCLIENLARELHEVYATHRENRARLAKAVKARGFYVNKSKGGKKGSKGGGKSKDSGKAGKGSGGKSKGKGSGKARGMSLEQLKQVTSCADCGEMCHWRGDTQCKNPAKKAHETVNVDFEDTEQYEAYFQQDYPYDDWHEWEPDTNEAWVTNKYQTWDDEKVSVSKKQTAAEAFPQLDYEEAKHVVKTVNAVKRKASEHAGSSGDVPPEQAGLTPATRPLDVFTATAQVKEQIESRKLKPVARTATAPEAVREAFEILGVTPPPRSGSVWDCLSATEDEKTFDLDSMRWLTGKAYMESAAPKTTHIYNPEDDPLATGDIYGLHPCTVHGDVWEYNMDNPLLYIRRHRRPRTARFHPQDVVDGPEPRELQMVRVTYKDGAPEPIVDTWDQKVEEEPWTGYTVLVGLDCEPRVQMVASTPAHAKSGSTSRSPASRELCARSL